MTGTKYGRAEVISFARNDKYGNALWNCKCDCGKMFVTNGQSLRNGHTKSCGCYHSDRTKERQTIHNMSSKRIYRIWAGMKSRCYNKNNAEYEMYGGRGISICDEWNEFEKFKDWSEEHGYKETLTIDRIDNNEGYSPSNCRWTTRAEQNRNTSRTHRIKDGDRILTASQVAYLVGVSRSVVAAWCRNGEVTTLDEAVARRNAIKNGRYTKRESIC